MTAPSPDDPIDQLVRQHLDREVARVDPSAVLLGVRNRSRTTQTYHRRVFRWSAAFVGLAAAIWLILWGLPTSTASAESLILQAKEVHSAPVDRLYRIDPQLEINWARRPAVLEFQRKLHLWTRGDRFYLVTGGEHHQWSWGKDERGRYWLALSPKVGLVFNLDELDDVTLTTDIYSMRLESLLGELPKDFDLKRVEIPDRPGFVRIVATPRQRLPNQRLREASLEMDTRTKVVHKLTLKRTVRGETTITVNYTLIETASLPDSDYQLSGHLEADGISVGPENPLLRNYLWRRILERRGKAP